MKTQKPKNWLVLFQPKDEITVGTMKVVDAWSSTSAKLSDAKRVMIANMPEYFAKYGEGSVEVVKCTGSKVVFAEPARETEQRSYPDCDGRDFDNLGESPDF